MESMDKERRRGVLERKYGEEERRRSIDSRRKRCPRGVLLGTLRLFENLVSDFVDLAQTVERRSEEPLALVRFQESTCNSNRVGSSAVERRYAKAEARVRFPAGAWIGRSDNSVEQSAGLPNRRRGFDSHSLHECSGAPSRGSSKGRAVVL